MRAKDPDFDWLEAHQPKGEVLPERYHLAANVGRQLHDRIKRGQMPYTLGVFGGWGSGKTTFLALLANELRLLMGGARIIYFNSWKYAGLTEVLPSLIYKILQQGVPDTDKNRNQAALRVLASLGKEYSDKLGKWAEERIGVDPVDLFKDVLDLTKTVEAGGRIVPPEVMRAYYTQVDQAQDALEEALGRTEPGKAVAHPVIVLIDELDRCDPDEAFNVIKQLRVLFAMRRLPTAFVVCANPEPIGLAIKHRYGLESEAGDYEARRILEKFVDAYEDFSEPVSLGGLARALWSEAGAEKIPWIIELDEANGDVGFAKDTASNARVFDMMDSSIPYYSNLRVFRKTLEYLKGQRSERTSLVWTLWHLELAEQVDPKFRAQLRTMASSIKNMMVAAYGFIGSDITFRADGARLVYRTDKGNTLFAILRSRLWETGREELARLGSLSTPQDAEAAKALQHVLADDRKMNFLTSLCLLPFNNAPNHAALKKAGAGGFGKLLDDGLARHFGWLVRYA